jgi:hypothetical protein
MSDLSKMVDSDQIGVDCEGGRDGRCGEKCRSGMEMWLTQITSPPLLDRGARLGTTWRAAGGSRLHLHCRCRWIGSEHWAKTERAPCMGTSRTENYAQRDAATLGCMGWYEWRRRALQAVRGATLRLVAG